LHHEEFEEVHVCYEENEDKERYLQGVWLKWLRYIVLLKTLMIYANMRL
jgi:hypothetical protein